jgi:hypothetical protein
MSRQTLGPPSVRRIIWWRKLPACVLPERRKLAACAIRAAFVTARRHSLLRFTQKLERLSLAAKFADMRYKRLACVGSKTLLVCGHLPLAFGNNREELSVGLALHFGGAQIAGL